MGTGSAGSETVGLEKRVASATVAKAGWVMAEVWATEEGWGRAAE